MRISGERRPRRAGRSGWRWSIGLVLVAGLVVPGDGALAQQTPGRPGVLPQPPQGPVTLSLGETVRLAGDTVPQVTLAGLRTEEALGRLRQARSIFFPTFDGGASFIRQTRNLKSFGFSLPVAPGEPGLPIRIGPFNVWDFRGQAAQTLFDPSGWLRARAAREQVNATRADSGATAQTARAQAGAAYIGVARARAMLGAGEETLRIARELVTLARSQFEAGVGTRLDVVRSRAQEAQARATIELAQTQLTQAQIDLARALGLPPGTRFTVTDTLGAALARSDAPETAEAAVALALQRRPELRAAESAREAARLAGRALTASRLGRLSMEADYGLNGPDREDMITTGQVAVQYSIPVFEGFRLEGQRQEQEAQLREAEVRLADLRQQVAGEVGTALAGVQSGLAQQTIAREEVDLALEELREARLRYQNGIAGNIEVVNAQANLIRARNALIDARAQTAQARVRLARAVGVTQTLR